MHRTVIAASSHRELKPSANRTRLVPIFEFLPELKRSVCHLGTRPRHRGDINFRGWLKIVHFEWLVALAPFPPSPHILKEKTGLSGILTRQKGCNPNRDCISIFPGTMWAKSDLISFYYFRCKVGEIRPNSLGTLF